MSGRESVGGFTPAGASSIEGSGSTWGRSNCSVDPATGGFKGIGAATGSGVAFSGESDARGGCVSTAGATRVSVEGLIEDSGSDDLAGMTSTGGDGGVTGAVSVFGTITAAGVDAAGGTAVWRRGLEGACWIGRRNEESFAGIGSACGACTGGGAAGAGAAMAVCDSTGVGAVATGGMVAAKLAATVETGAGTWGISTGAGLGGTGVRVGCWAIGDASAAEGLRPRSSAFCVSKVAMSSFSSPILCAASALLPVRSLCALLAWYSGDFSPKMRRMVSRRDSSVLARTASR